MSEQACPQQPQTVFPTEDYEIQVYVDFENRLLRPLGVFGVSEEEARTSEILVFARDRCRPDCTTDGCLKCRSRKLYQDWAGNPKGAVNFVPHIEYLYCLRLHGCQRPRAILSLTPREQNVEVKELGLLAYWFATWFQRVKAGGDGVGEGCPADDVEVDVNDGRFTADDVDSEEAELTPTKIVALATAAAAKEGGIVRRSETRQILNSTSKYLPNIQVAADDVEADVVEVCCPADDDEADDVDSEEVELTPTEIVALATAAAAKEGGIVRRSETRQSLVPAAAPAPCVLNSTSKYLPNIQVAADDVEADVVDGRCPADEVKADVVEVYCPADDDEADDVDSEEVELTPMEIVALATAAAAKEGGIVRRSETRQSLVPAAAPAPCILNSTSKYLPNLQVAANDVEADVVDGRCPADDIKADGVDSEEAELTPTKIVALATAAAAEEGGIVKRSVPAEAPAPRGLNSTSKYLPNMRIVYQVKQERMTVTMPEPQQLSREIDILLVRRGGNTVDAVQTATLSPGVAQASQELTTLRDTPYTLMVRLRDLGSPLKLLDLVTEKKVLRVQESLLAPKHMNFLMERRVDQRTTFVLHITFDEKGVDVDNKWLGEFFLDVDFERNTLNIGTSPGNARKVYRVEELVGPDQADWTKARRVQWFEGGVDATTLFIQETVPIHMMADYLITVIDPDSGTELPTSVLCIGAKYLYVKEVKGSDVRLHVTVQRQFDVAAAAAAVANVNNYTKTEVVAETNSASLSYQRSTPVRRSRSDGVFHCPIGSGRTRYRIQHNAGGTPDTTAATEEASCVCSSGGVGCDDSGIGRNPSSLSESSLDSLAAQCQQRRRQQLHRTEATSVEPDGEREHQRDFNVNLDVDLPKLQARLLPGGGTGSGGGGGGCYLIVEDSIPEGRTRSIPCQLGQSFAVLHWCRYTVKAIGETWVKPLFSFRLTDADVTDIVPCNPTVRLTKNVSHR